jgi:hypothetical protein
LRQCLQLPTYLSEAANYLQMMLLLALLQMAVTRPSNFEEFGSQPHEDKCKEGHSMVVEVCQRCAKQTKSPIVYPMCCVNEDDVYNWCGKYINYGKKSK